MMKYDVKKIIDKVILYFQNFLKFVIQILRVIRDFLKSFGNLLPDFSNPATFFKAILNLVFYSKLLVIIAMVAPIPSPILIMSNEIWSTAEFGLAQIRFFYGHMEEILTESKVKSFTISRLSSELEDLHESIERDNIEVTKQNDAFRSEISQLKTQLLREQDLKNVLTNDNQDLIRQLKASKLATQMDQVNKWSSLLGTTFFIGKEAYRYFNPLPTDASNIEEILKGVRDLVIGMNRANINRTAYARQNNAASNLSNNQSIDLNEIDNSEAPIDI